MKNVTIHTLLVLTFCTVNVAQAYTYSCSGSSQIRVQIHSSEKNTVIAQFHSRLGLESPLSRVVFSKVAAQLQTLGPVFQSQVHARELQQHPTNAHIGGIKLSSLDSWKLSITYRYGSGHLVLYKKDGKRFSTTLSCTTSSSKLNE